MKLTLAERRRYHTAVQVFKSIRKLSPMYLHDQFSNTYDLTGHFGRNQFRIFIPRVRTSFGKSSFYFQGAVLWNQLNFDLYQTSDLRSLQTFYKRLYS